MSLTDVMSGAGLAVYAEIALVLFLLIFTVVLATIVSRARNVAWEQAKQLPLEGDGVEHAPSETR